MDRINPKKLFLLDSLGELLSAIMLGVVLPRFKDTFGMPPMVLYVLAFLASLFAIYSFCCFLRVTEQWRSYMKMIAVANLGYCGLTLGLVIYLHQELTPLGMLYFGCEIVIIIGLATVELRKASYVVVQERQG